MPERSRSRKRKRASTPVPSTGEESSQGPSTAAKDAQKGKEAPKEPEATVSLVLDYSKPNKHVVLNLPLQVITRNVVAHFKYLHFCAAYITGIRTGHLSQSQDGPPHLGPVYVVVAKQKWWWVVPPGEEAFGDAAIHLSAGSTRPSRSQTSGEINTRTSFKNELVERDGTCVFTGVDVEICQGMHIIPHHVSDSFYEDIFAKRTLDDDDVNDVKASELAPDDPRNGLLVTANIHLYYERAHVAILATPNHVLDTSDLHPEEALTLDMRSNMNHPPVKRFTLQILKTLSDPRELGYIPSNVSAQFKQLRPDPSKPESPDNPPLYPHAALCNYSYACRLVRNYGGTHQVYRNRPHMPRPPAPSRDPSSRTSACAHGYQQRELVPRGDRGELIVRLDASRKAPAATSSHQNAPTSSHQNSSHQHQDDIEPVDDQLTPEGDWPTSSHEEDDEESLFDEHPDGMGRFGEDGRISAEDFMYSMYMKKRPVVKDQDVMKDREADQSRWDRVGEWREGVEVAVPDHVALHKRRRR